MQLLMCCRNSTYEELFSARSSKRHSKKSALFGSSSLKRKSIVIHSYPLNFPYTIRYQISNLMLKRLSMSSIADIKYKILDNCFF